MGDKVSKRTMVVKKDGRKIPFYIEKVASNLDSMERVFGVTYKKDKDSILHQIKTKVEEYEEIPSYKILEILEYELRDEPLVMMAFKQFKQQEKLDLENAVDLDYQLERFHNRDKEIMNENGNKDSRTAMTQRDLLSGVVAKAKGLALYPEDVQRAHLKGVIHLHDLTDSPYHGKPNCSLPDFEYMLKNGSNLGNAKVEQPKSLETAVSVLGILIASISSDQYGGISVHELDKLLLPYGEMTHKKNLALYEEVVSDKEEVERLAKKKTKKDIYDAMQSLEYDINTMMTSTAQTPQRGLSVRDYW